MTVSYDSPPADHEGTPPTPSINSVKGKAKALATQLSSAPHLDWELGWEQAQAMVDMDPRPFAWASNNVVYYSHSQLPRVCARFVHPNTSAPPTTFDLPIPPVEFSPFDPPSLIATSPASFRENWVFAYFPTHLPNDTAGVACIWSANPLIGIWSIVHWWSIEQKHTPVTCKWLGQPRELQILPTQAQPSKGPQLGPCILKSPMLMLVTRSNNVDIILRATGNTGTAFSLMRAPLYTTWATHSGLETDSTQMVYPLGGHRTCTKAAIGLCTNYDSIIIATVSKLLPRPPAATTQHIGPLNLEELTAPQGSSTAGDYVTWEHWGEEEKIDLCEIKITTIPERTILETSPLDPVPVDFNNMFSSSEMDGLETPNAQMSHLVLSNVPVPSTVFGQEDVAAPTPDLEVLLTLAASFIDFGDYTSNPRSAVQHWALKRVPVPDLDKEGDNAFVKSEPGDVSMEPLIMGWNAEILASRLWESEFISMLQPLPLLDGERLCVGLVPFNGVAPAGHTKVEAGHLRALTALLEDDPEYDLTTLHSRRRLTRLEFSTRLVVSPNKSLMALTAPETTSVTIDHTPRRASASSPVSSVSPAATLTGSDEGTAEPHEPHPLAIQFAESVLKSNDAGDLYNAFWTTPGTSVELARKVMCDVFLLMYPDKAALLLGASDPKDATSTDLRLDWRLLRLSYGLLKSCPSSDVDQRSYAAINIIRLQASMDALRELGSLVLQGNDTSATPDQQPAIKRLISVIAQHSKLCELIVKECLVWEAWRSCGGDKMEPAEKRPHPSPVLLILIHPYFLLLLHDVYKYIRTLVDHLRKVSHASQKYVDRIVEESKINFEVWPNIIETVKEINGRLMRDVPGARRLLSVGALSFSLPEQLSEAVNACTVAIANRPGLCNKLALMVPSLEYPDLQFNDAKSRKGAHGGRHGPLLSSLTAVATKYCARCGEEGEHRVHDMMSVSLYGAYERNYKHQCFCGGRWIVKA